MSSRPRQSEALGRYASTFQDALSSLDKEQVSARIWAKDASLWKREESHQKIIRNSLGWLHVARMMHERARELEEFSSEIIAAGFKHLMLLGMGGSSLCPEVFRRTFGQRKGFPELLVLDTTDPDTIASFEHHVDLERTLFIVSSKSGTTIEPLSFYKYFFDRVRSIKRERAGENLVAITDPGTLMERMARESNFRRVFLNPSDIGGRYSALSYFGIVPASLMGLEVEELLTRAVAAMQACDASLPVMENEGARLGAVMGALGLEGLDKLTLVADSGLASLGLWIEQLVAESTGKEGRGIVPVAGEALAGPEAYGADRLFVSISAGEVDAEAERKLRALEDAGHPVVRRVLNDKLDLGAEFFVWEFATAVAGRILGINPFDQPNVQESKDATNALLEEFKTSGALPEEEAAVTEDSLKVYSARKPDAERAASSGALTLRSVIKDFISQVKAGDYVALLAYLQESSANDELLGALRLRLRERFRVATTTGYGPRFLHSTGQLHKGGADNGVFIQLTDDDHTDLAIPGEPYTFSTLKQAQALGDFSSLAKRNRRAVRVHLGANAEEGLRRLEELLSIASAEEQSRSAS